jgi:hypothetical protein
MSGKLDRSQSGKSALNESRGEPARGFSSAPSAEQLRPTERETFLLDTLLKWQESSARSQIVLGQPLNS